LFTLVLPQNNIFGVYVKGTTASTQSVSDGFWVFLSPLTAGSHQIALKARYQGSFGSLSSNPVAEDVTYHLTVR